MFNQRGNRLSLSSIIEKRCIGAHPSACAECCVGGCHFFSSPICLWLSGDLRQASPVQSERFLSLVPFITMSRLCARPEYCQYMLRQYPIHKLERTSTGRPCFHQCFTTITSSPSISSSSSASDSPPVSSPLVAIVVSFSSLSSNLAVSLASILTTLAVRAGFPCRLSAYML